MLLVLLCSGSAIAQPTPPTQPKSGPGGSDYTYEQVRATEYGEGADGYWIIEPVDAGDEPLPVVLFAHGLNQTNYAAYGSWIRHLARHGNLVIFPRYQTGGAVDPKTFTPQTAQAMREALKRCDGKKHPEADVKRFSMVGHSLGGTIIANLAARPNHYGLPVPKALMLLQPGDTRADKGFGAFFPSITEDHSTIAKGTLMLIVDVVGDYYVSAKGGTRIYDKAELIDTRDKDRLLLETDEHGNPALVADHMLPFAWPNGRGRGKANAYDFAQWRWFDALMATAYGDEAQRKFVLGNTTEQRAIGRWSDGTPVREPEVYQSK